MTAMKKIGFIGIGIMGKSMVRNLMKAGYDVSVYNRTKSKAEDVIAEGAHWCENAGQCAFQQDIVISIVGFPKDVEEVYFGPAGIIANAKPGAYIIDMTTTTPKLSVRIYEEAKKKGVFALDAPVSGGDTGAKNGTLAIMVGGDKEAFDACLPVFQAMGKNIMYEGKAGCGQHCKAANQIALCGTLASCAEAITYAEKNGLDPKVMLDTISTGAAGSWQLDNNGRKMLVEDYKPGFMIDHYIKDLRIAEEGAKDAGFELPIVEKVLAMFLKLQEEGDGRLGTQAIIKEYNK